MKKVKYKFEQARSVILRLRARASTTPTANRVEKGRMRATEPKRTKD